MPVKNITLEAPPPVRATVNLGVPGSVDIGLPCDPMLITDMLFMSGASTVGLAGTIGTPDNPSELSDTLVVGVHPSSTRRTFNKIVEGGVLRITVGTPSSGASAGRVVIQGEQA